MGSHKVRAERGLEGTPLLRALTPCSPPLNRRHWTSNMSLRARLICSLLLRGKCRRATRSVSPRQGMNLCVPPQSQPGRRPWSLCYLRDVLITSDDSSPACKTPPDHRALWASSYLLSLSSPSITVHGFYLSLHGLRLISMNNWNSWLVTRWCCHQGGWGCDAHNWLFLSLHSCGKGLVPATLTFCMDHGYSFLAAPLPSFLPHPHPRHPLPASL